MNRLLKALIIRDTGNRIPVINKFIATGWDLGFSTIDQKYETIWKAKIELEHTASVSNMVKIPEYHIKEELLKNLQWQIYGDSERYLIWLIEAIHDKRNEDAREIALLLKNEIKGN